MKGICFIEPLFHKVVKGEKTQTRRIINIQPLDSRNWRVGTTMDSTAKEDREIIGKNHYLLLENEYTIKESDGRYFTPKYKVGEKVYLKEPYFIFDEEDNSCFYKYLPKVDWLTDKEFLDNVNSISRLQGWKNKLFMPESAARYFIEITAVRAERLQDISEEDCIKEGITLYDESGKYLGHGYIDTYAALIDKINGKGTWEKNPFVWVYDFKLVK